MDDFADFIIAVILAFCGIVIIVCLAGLASENGNDDKKEDKRYELCLKRDMQWVEGNCIAK
jgi:hypothetical protein